MKRILAVAALAWIVVGALMLSGCRGDSTVLETVKTNTGECWLFVHENIAFGKDVDTKYVIPCEITTNPNIED